jgi:hypothetical protein
LGASNYTYVEATDTQRSADFIQSHSHAVEYVGGVPAAIVPDQLRTGIRDPCRYEPILQRTYEEWATHYHTAIVPARPAKPRDKAKAEVGVQVAQRWVLARLRHETFFSLAALNARIRELLTDLNARPMKGYGGLSRPGARESRLPRRRGAPLLLGAVCAHPSAAGHSAVGDDRRSVSAGHARLGASAERHRRRLHDGP